MTVVISQGSPVPVYMRVLIGGLGILGLLALPIGLLLGAACGLALGYTGGTELDAQQRRLREYSAIFGIRWGKWLPLDTYRYVSVLHVRRSTTAQGRAGGSTDVHEMNYDVVLLDGTHRKKYLVSACGTINEAQGMAAELAMKLGFEIVKFAPQPLRERRR